MRRPFNAGGVLFISSERGCPSRSSHDTGKRRALGFFRARCLSLSPQLGEGGVRGGGPNGAQTAHLLLSPLRNPSFNIRYVFANRQ